MKRAKYEKGGGSELGGKRVPDQGFEQFERFLDAWSRRDFLKRTGGVLAWGAFTAGGAELVAACGPAPSTTQNVQKAVKGGHLTEAQSTDIRNFNPTLVQDVNSSIHAGLLFENLLTSKRNGDLIPALAKEVPNPSADGLTYKFDLRRDVRWTDGQPVTAEDVLFTYNVMWAPEYRDVKSPRRGDLTETVQSITAPDKYTVVFKTKGVYAPFLTLHAQYGILPKHVLGNLPAAAINLGDFNLKPTVTNGVFKFVSYEKGQQVTLARNKTYYRGAANLEKYIYKVIPDSVNLANQLKTGEIDVGPVEESGYADLSASSDLAVTTFPVAIFLFYAYQLDPSKPGSTFFQDKRVRQALLYALDRQAIVDAIFFKQAVVADSVIPPVSWAHAVAKPQYPFDPKKAEQLLDDAGWKRGPDGIRAKDGVPMRFRTTTNADRKVRPLTLNAMQEQWRKIGVDVTRNDLPHLAQAAGELTDAKRRDFDIFMTGFSWSQDPDESSLFHSRNTADGGFNGFSFKNAEADRLLDQASSTVDQAKRKDLYKKFQDLMAEEVAAPILLFNKSLWAVNKRVAGMRLDTYNQYSSRPWMKDVFVTDGK